MQMINCKIDEKQAKIVLSGIKSRGENLTMSMKDIANNLKNSVTQNFEEGGRWSGDPKSLIGGSKKWEPNHYKKKKGTVLITTHNLQNSIFPKSTKNEAIVYSGLNYATIHNFGGTIPAHKITARNGKALKITLPSGQILFRKSANMPEKNIPARPFMVAQPEDIDYAKEVILEHIKKD